MNNLRTLILVFFLLFFGLFETIFGFIAIIAVCLLSSIMFGIAASAFLSTLMYIHLEPSIMGQIHVLLVGSAITAIGLQYGFAMLRWSDKEFGGKDAFNYTYQVIDKLLDDHEKSNATANG